MHDIEFMAIVRYHMYIGELKLNHSIYNCKYNVLSLNNNIKTVKTTAYDRDANGGQTL